MLHVHTILRVDRSQNIVIVGIEDTREASDTWSETSVQPFECLIITDKI